MPECQPAPTALTGSGSVLLVDDKGQFSSGDELTGLVFSLLGIDDSGRSLLEQGPVALRHGLRRALADPPDSTMAVIELDGRFIELRFSRLQPSDRPLALLQVRDMTFERRLEERCLALDKYDAFDQLLASVVHDTRNPLSAATTLIETVQMLGGIDQPNCSRLGEALDNIVRASDILENLVRFTRDDESPTFHPLDLNQIVEQTLRLQRTNLRHRGISVEVKLEPELPQIYADPTQLAHILMNLIGNAADAIEDAGRPGTIWVNSSSRHGVVRLCIEDDGPGVPQAAAGKVFSPFFTTKPEGKGTGLGLAISHGIAKSHGGHLWLRSRQPHGASFVLDLPDPRAMLPAKEKSFLGVSQTRGAALVALVQDTDSHQLEASAQLLRRKGFKVHTAASGAGALRKLHAIVFDLVICSWELGDMAPDEFLRQASLKLGPDSLRHFSFAASNPDAPDLHALALRHGMQRLPKPYGPTELEELLERLETLQPA